MKKLILTLITLFGILTSQAAFADNNIKVIVGGEKLVSDIAPMIIDNRTMLPARAVFEALDARVSFIAEEQKVIAEKTDIKVEFEINSKIMKINGTEKEIDVPATIVNNRTLVPLRACAEAFELEILWNQQTLTARIKKPVSLLSERGSSEGFLVKNTYDENGNLTSIEYPSGITTTYEYDAQGTLSSENQSLGVQKNHTLNDYGDITYSEGTNGEWVKAEYDDNGNLIYVENSYGTWKKNTYDAGLLIKTESSDGTQIEYKYDENGFLTEQKSRNLTKKFTYDEHGRLVLCESSSGAWEKYTYDGPRLIRYDDYMDMWANYSYDENDNLIYTEYWDGTYDKYIVVIK